MTTLVLPEQFKPGALPDVWAALTAELAKAKPGDVVQNPYAGVVWPCDRTVVIPAGVECQFEGATLQQRTLRPFGQTRSDVTIVNERHLLIPSGSPLIPVTADFGWVEGPGIPDGTHIKLDYNRRGGTLEQDCVDGTGLPVTFTSQQDRARAGLKATGKDSQIHNVTTKGPEHDPDYEWSLEAQHGLDSEGSTNLVLRGVNAIDMHGDVLYVGASGARITTFLDAQGGNGDYCARSGIVPINCADCTIDRYTFDHIGRTMVNIEPPNAGCKTDRLKVTHPTFRKNGSGFTVLSSGGHVHAHVGSVMLSDAVMSSDDAPMWLVKGDNNHLRGPYFILRCRSTYPNGYGTSYPTAAQICIDHARSGSKVIDNKGFKLQPGRTPAMALVRHRNSGTVEVHGNDHDGFLEVGPWI